MFLQRLAVEKFAHEAFGVRGALAVRGDDDGPPLMVMRQVVFKRSFHVAPGDFKGFFGGSFFGFVAGIIRMQMRLPVARSEDAPCAV